jgi:hypothetical protein
MHEPLHAQNNEINSSTDFLCLYPILLADALLGVTMTITDGHM